MGTILFIVSNQRDNLGDVIQNRNIIRVFRQIGDIIIDDRYLKEEHCRHLGVTRTQLLSENKYLPDLRKLSGILKLMLSRSKQYNAVVRIAASKQYSCDIRSIINELARLLIFTLLHLKGIQIYQFGMTGNPSKLHGILLRIERAQSRMHSVYSVRDISVYERLRGLFFYNLFYCPDVFYWDAPRNCHYDRIAGQDVILTVLISLRESIPDNPNKSDYERKLVGKVSSIIDALPQDTRVIFSYQVPMDYEINRRMSEKHKGRRNCCFIESCLDEQTAERLYRNCSLIISNRQHCVLYGATLGVPILALTDTNLHWKLCGALYDLGVPEYLVDIHDDDAHVISKCKAILQQRDSISNTLMTAVKKKRVEAIMFLRERLQLEIEVI